MKRMIIVADGWPCLYQECPPGLFVIGEERTLCLKTEYEDYGSFCASSGEVFWGGVKTKEGRAKLVVQPVVARWVEEP